VVFGCAGGLPVGPSRTRVPDHLRCGAVVSEAADRAVQAGSLTAYVPGHRQRDRLRREGDGRSTLTYVPLSLTPDEG
jgi:hypothetical protein